MHIDEWAILIGVMTSCALAVGPWMFKVHAKLAVIASKIGDVSEKLETGVLEQRRLWETCARHEIQLGMHAAEITRLSRDEE